MGLPTPYGYSGLARGFNHTPLAIKSRVEQFAERLIPHFSEIGDDTIAGAYFGRSFRTVKAQGQAVAAHYFELSLSGQPFVLDACTRAANNRLRVLRVTGVLQPDDIGDPAVYSPGPGWLPQGEPMPHYLRRLKSAEESDRYMDQNPLVSYEAIDAFLFEQPGWPDLRDAEPNIEHLLGLPALDMERRLILGGTYAAMVQASRPQHAATPELSPVSTLTGVAA